MNRKVRDTNHLCLGVVVVKGYNPVSPDPPVSRERKKQRFNVNVPEF